MGFFTFLPAIGTVICLVLGVMRANPFVVLITSTIGKFLRYAILAYMVFSLAH
jgi:membrane protein YqaA with SNARE-associated domain